MRTPFDPSSAESAAATCALPRLVPATRAAAAALAFVACAALYADAASEAVPVDLSSGMTVGRAYAPRLVSKKVDPVEALLAKQDRGQGHRIDPHTLPGTFVVKFVDAAKVRMLPDAGEGLPGFVSLSGWDVDHANALLRFFNASGRRWLSRSESDLAEIEMRARDNSGRMQPDLAGMIRVDGVPTHRLVEAARAFSDMDEVEFVVFEQRTANLQSGCDPTNPAFCEQPAPSCTNPEPGTDTINRTECNIDPAAEPRPTGCNDPACCDQVGAIDAYCEDENDDRGWDVFCAALANMICTPVEYPEPTNDLTDGQYDPCFFNELEDGLQIEQVFEPVHVLYQQAPCVSAHSGRGCGIPLCCDGVCRIDPSCCEVVWDAPCANLALSGVKGCDPLPPSPDTEPSPDLTLQQTESGLVGYTYHMQGGPRPASLPAHPFLAQRWWKGSIAGGPLGFTGHGLALQEMEDFQNLIWENYQGGDPASNPFLRGGTVRIGIIESSAYANHEDFVLAGPPKIATRPWDGPLLGEPKLTVEAGQDPLYVEQGPISANHGTNVAGLILAADNGVGVTGVASDATGILYPTFSALGGFRGQDAIASALVDLRPGDVMTFSWGFLGTVPYFNDRLNNPLTTVAPGNPPPYPQDTQPINPVTSNLAYSTLIGVGSAAGITSVVAAGTGPVPILGSSEIDQFALIVTATYPGNMTLDTSSRPGYEDCSRSFEDENLFMIRYPYGNYQAEAETADERASASGWGWAVATTGATTRFDNTTLPNPELSLFQGLNDAPPSSNAANLQIDRLRQYTQEFGGTSAAAAMVAGVVARVQASAKQYFGAPLMPDQIRGVFENHPGAYGQCACSTGGPPGGRDLPFNEGPRGQADSCSPALCRPACTPANCPCDVRTIGFFPNLLQLPATVLNGGTADGNDVDVEVITGGRLIGYSWSSFQIRAEDGNFLQINAERAQAGTTRRGLTYLSTGLTTDVRVTRPVDLPNPATDLNDIAVRMVSQSTRNFVMAGVFIRNFETNRYEFIGAQFLTTAGIDATVPIPESPSYGRYVNPETNEIDVRIWTCGLGATGRHVVRHDLVEIVLNLPFEPL